MAKSIRLQVTFRSGAQIECNVTEYTFEKQRGVIRFTWSSSANPSRRLDFIDANEICAIVVIK